VSWPERPSDPVVRPLPLPGGALALTDEGEGPAVLAIHGLPGSRFDFRYLAPAAPRTRFLRVDLPGFGESPGESCGPTADAHAAVLTEALDAIGVGEVALLAHSFGAGLAAHLAHRLGDRARGLAVLAPAGLRPHNVLRHQRTVRALGAAARTPGLGWGVGHALIPAYRAVGFKRASAAEARRTFAVVGGWDWAGTREVAAALGARRLPALVTYAEDDPIVEQPRMQAWADTLGVAPLAFPTGGHTVQKTRATEIGAALMAWLDGLPSS
jgi:pimeloyl-ACP methyl ester carboxylesterase